jgi:hypothetical protein
MTLAKKAERMLLHTLQIPLFTVSTYTGPRNETPGIRVCGRGPLDVRNQ